MGDFLAWSYSRRKTFLDCPKQLYHTAVLKKHDPAYVGYVEGKAQKAGKDIDAALTARISQGTALLPQFAPYEGMVQAVLAAPGTKLTQVQLALDQAFKPCGYMDWNTVWVRAIYDLVVINGDYAYLADWKNGKVWLDEDQLKLFAAVGFHQFPDVEVIDTSYIWLSYGVTSDKQYKRRELPDLWNALLPDVERMQAAYKANHWPAEPKYGKSTCKWCPVNRDGKCQQAQGPYGGS